MEQLRIGDKAPNFSAKTTYGNMELNDYKGKWCIFFSHPGDFTPVCTTEFLSFTKYNEEFKKRNCYLLGLSIDSNSSHLAWLYNIYKNTGITIPFPVISDRDMSISKLYNMLPNIKNSTETVRSIYIIDENQIIRAILQYPINNGRNIPEILRLIDAIQLSDLENIATPANWYKGNPVVVKPPETYNELIERLDIHKNNLDWYLCYKEDKINSNIPIINNDYINNKF